MKYVIGRSRSNYQIYLYRRLVRTGSLVLGKRCRLDTISTQFRLCASRNHNGQCDSLRQIWRSIYAFRKYLRISLHRYKLLDPNVCFDAGSGHLAGQLDSPESDPLSRPIQFPASPPDERLVRIGLAEGESGGLVTGLGAPNPLRGASRGSEPSARWHEASYR